MGLGRGQHSPPATATAKSLQSCLTLCDPIDGSPPGSPVPEILQARTLGVGCHCLLQCVKMKSESEVAQSCPTLCNLMDCSLPGSPIPGILKASGVGCHFLLQCMKMKSESDVAWSYMTLCDPMDCSLPSSSVHGIFQARELEWGVIAFSRELC